MKNFIQGVQETTIKMSGDNINQTQRNEIKANANKGLQALLVENGLQAVLVNGGANLKYNGFIDRVCIDGKSL